MDAPSGGAKDGRGIRKSLSIIRRQITRHELRVGAALYPYPEGVVRPKTRADCDEVERPCPFVSCRYHLYLDVSPSGTIVVNFPEADVHELKHSCSLDEALEGGMSLEEAGKRLNLTRERVRQLEGPAIAQVEAAGVPLPEEWIYYDESLDESEPE